MRNLGVAYRDGWGVAIDYAKAREWYEKAASKGEARAMAELGDLYFGGVGVPVNQAKAREWYEKAVTKDNVDAGVLYSYGLAPDYVKAREWYERAAQRGNATAMTELGGLYLTGAGMEQDYAKAREWLEKAADDDEVGAMTPLGAIYHKGLGVSQDFAKARDWYERAAAKGDANAMFNLGILYSNGLGVAQDYVKAREWYEKAADDDHPGAMINLGVLYERGQGVAQDYARAREWYQKQADKGNVYAKALLEQLTITEAAKAGRYAEALQRQEAYQAKVEAEEIKREGKPGMETAQELRDLARYALFAREFTKALTVADHAHALVPDDLAIEANRAHALMFLGHGEEARALYLTHNGKSVSTEGDKVWEHAIAENFAEFRKVGLMHPMMADIEKELGVSR
jgi:TPR repeat protein